VDPFGQSPLSGERGRHVLHAEPVWPVPENLQHVGLDTQLTNVVLSYSCAKDGTQPSIFVFEQWKL
jgi:hypothetical protein